MLDDDKFPSSPSPFSTTAQLRRFLADPEQHAWWLDHPDPVLRHGMRLQLKAAEAVAAGNAFDPGTLDLNDPGTREMLTNMERLGREAITHGELGLPFPTFVITMDLRVSGGLAGPVLFVADSNGFGFPEWIGTFVR